MNDRTSDRASMLLKVRQREEDVAREAFEAARSRAETLCRLTVEMDRQLLSHDREARRRLLGGREQGPAGPYELNPGQMRERIDRHVTELRRADELLEQRRAELAEAVRKRRAAETLCGKLAGRLVARRRRGEDVQIDDGHAARTAVRDDGEAAGDSAWRE
jgi:hypothetical protein